MYDRPPSVGRALRLVPLRRRLPPREFSLAGRGEVIHEGPRLGLLHRPVRLFSATEQVGEALGDGTRGGDRPPPAQFFDDAAFLDSVATEVQHGASDVMQVPVQTREEVSGLAVRRLVN